MTISLVVSLLCGIIIGLGLIIVICGRVYIILTVITAKQWFKENLIKLHYNKISQFSYKYYCSSPFTHDSIQDYLQTEWLTFQDNRFINCDSNTCICQIMTQ
jgi:hypothetical protein